MKRQSAPMLLLLQLCFLSINTSAHAEFVWEQTIYEAKAKKGTKKERVVYRFQNKAEYPVVIRKIQASCGCTTVESERNRYEPGEKGEVTAVFTFGNRKGLQEKSIIVETDDPKGHNYVLLLRIELPDVISMTKKELVWEIGDPLEKQVLEIATGDGHQIVLKRVSSEGRAFDILWREVQEGKMYRIMVQPRSTDQMRSERLTIEFNEGGKRRALHFKAVVR